jgi:hypothetical protein
MHAAMQMESGVGTSPSTKVVQSKNMLPSFASLTLDFLLQTGSMCVFDFSVINHVF